MNCPPTKRLRGLNRDLVTAAPFDDPFGDEEEFTQDDLDEIDIIASQAITSGPGPGPGPGAGTASVPGTRPTAGGQSKVLIGAAANQSRGNAGKPGQEPFGRAQQPLGSDGGGPYRLLEAQHAELKRKLKEVEDEIVLKSGEIRVLRDSLKAAQQEKETRRQNQILLETERQREQSDREKELNRKVQSLQSELQFKEAEINEMKTRLHNSDKNKTASPLARNSPKVLSSLAQVHHGSSSSSPSPVGNGFISKEAFGAHISTRTTPVKSRRDDRAASSSSRSGVRCDASRPDPFGSVRPAHLQHRGGVLLRLLLQPPSFPSSLGLPRLLAVADSSQLSADLQIHSGPRAAAGAEGAAAPRAALTLAQSLAVTGLNLLSQSQPAPAASSRNHRSCPGAVLLLPLLDLHLSQLCLALDSLRSPPAGRGGSDSTAAGSLPAAGSALRPEETTVTGCSAADTGLAALTLLRVLLAHSNEVVEAVLLKESRSADHKVRSAARPGPCSQNALLQSLLRLCDTRLGVSGPRKEELVLGAMKTLRVLTERTSQAHLERLQCVVQAVRACVTAESRLQAVSECVSVLSAMCDHESLAEQLCSQHDPCVFLKLFTWLRTRPDNRAAHRDWILLDLQVLRLLSRLTQGPQAWMTNVHVRTCQCYIELVQTVVIIFHRQWLEVRDSQEPACPAGSAHSSPWWRGPAASLLREGLVQLHWLLLHHGSFSESCRPLLHMYDQMIPAARDTLRKIPELSESEELALEDICRSEGDDTDDMDTDTGC